MGKIAVFCVTYHSYEELQQYLTSVGIAAGNAYQVVDFYVCDNTEVGRQEISFSGENVNLKVFTPGKNLGYFGAIGYMMQQASPSGYDYVILSNVDIQLRPDALKVLLARKSDETIGWVAPEIFSSYESRDRNPKIVVRYNRRRIQIFRLCYRFPVLHYLYTKTAYKRKHLQSHNPGQIYAGHGSCLILTASYFEKCGIIDYPVFLYGEEIYVAENCRNAQLKVDYDPSVKILDGEHVSTGKMKKRFYYHCNFEAMDFVLKKYY